MSAIQVELASLATEESSERIRALKRIIPQAQVQQVLKQCRNGQAHCRRLSKVWMVWFVIAMALFCRDSYRQVCRWLMRYRRKTTPSRSTLCEARQRLGVAPLRLLHERVVQLLGTPQTPGAFYKGMRLMAIDGFKLNVADTPANERAFGRPQSGRAAGAFPQVLVVALCEVGSHVLWKVLLKPHNRGEIVLAHYLLRLLKPDMLLLWDRHFLSFQTVSQVLACPAQLLARIKSNLVFVPLEYLPDGSYLAKLHPSPSHRRRDEGGVKVRIIEYTLDDPNRNGHGQRHRLLTTLLDWQAHPAHELAVLYHQRWEEELAIDEFKTHEMERVVLHSQTPAGVVQEVYGLLLGHYVVRKVMFEAATQQRIDPQRVSFTDALKIIRCRLPEAPRSYVGLRRWYEALVAEVSEEILPPRRNRANPRVIKQKMSRWPKKRPEHRNYPQPQKAFPDSVVLLN